MVDRVFGDRYRVVGLVGTGPMSQVFVADDLTDGSRVALKVFDQALGEDPELADRIIGALQTASLVQHANIASPLDFGLDGVRVWAVSELFEGGSLRALLASGHKLTPSQALVMSLECARGLAHAHANGLPHRALKPENVLFTNDQRLRISDFGLEQVLSTAPLSRSSQAIERIRYTSPEQARGRNVTEAADVYALALLANEAVCGTPPAAGETVVGTLMARAEAPAELSAELGALRPPLERCGRLEPSERPEADELAIALLASAETMSRPGALPLAGLPGFDLHRLGPTSANEPEDITDDTLDPAEVQIPGFDSEESASLVAVPDLPDLLALEDLELAEPTFADAAPDEPALDVPTAASSARRGAAAFRQDTDDLDDQLPVWPVLLLGLLIAGAVALWFVLSSAGGGGADQVPNVVGLDEAELTAVAAGSDWDIERLETRINGTTKGAVVSQVPEAGTELDAGETLVVTVSLGGEMVEIPNDLLGLTLQQAQERLAVSSLFVGTVTEENSESLDAGLVVGIDEPTRQKPQGEAVSLRVSIGAEARIVPESVIGTTIADATAVLAGLRLQAIEEQVYDPSAEAGTVLGAVPSPGQTVPADSQVTLLVSAGPEPVVMPDVTDLALADAVDIIESFGLIFVDTVGTPGEPVIGTIPSAGEIVDVGAEVTIVLDEVSEEDEEAAEDEG